MSCAARCWAMVAASMQTLLLDALAMWDAQPVTPGTHAPSDQRKDDDEIGWYSGLDVTYTSTHAINTVDGPSHRALAPL